MRPRYRPARCDIGRFEADDVGVGQVEADVDQLHPPAVRQRVHRLEAAERDGQRGVHSRATDRAGRYVDAAGDVDGHDRDRQPVDRCEDLGGIRPQRARAGDTDHPIDDQIGGHLDAVDDAAAGFAERGQALVVGAFRLEQDRIGGNAAAAQVGRGPQCVATVVAGSDDRTHPPSGDSPGASGQFGEDHGRQSVCRARHQSAIGEARQQRRFGLAYRVSRVVVPHRAQVTCPASRVQSFNQANYRDVRATRQ